MQSVKFPQRRRRDIFAEKHFAKFSSSVSDVDMPLLTELCFLWMMSYKDAAADGAKIADKEHWIETGTG